MKSLLFTGLLLLGVAHTGAFLDVWEVPHVDNHITLSDVGRKLDRVFKWRKQRDALRTARDQAREENYALYEAPGGAHSPMGRLTRDRTFGPLKPMSSRSTSRK